MHLLVVSGCRSEDDQHKKLRRTVRKHGQEISCYESVILSFLNSAFVFKAKYVYLLTHVAIQVWRAVALPLFVSVPVNISMDRCRQAPSAFRQLFRS